MIWPWIAVFAALVLAAVWISAARAIVRLRRELLHIAPPTDREFLVPVGGRLVSVRHNGAKVRRWDRLSAFEQRKLILCHALAGAGAAVLTVVGIWGLVFR